MKNWRMPFILLIGSIFIAGCTPSNTLPLTETQIFKHFGYSIDYPEGWFAASEGPLTWIIELESDFEQRRDSDHPYEGISIHLEHRLVNFLYNYGLPKEDRTINDLFSLNINELTGMTDPMITETKLFGVETLRSEYYEEGHWDISYAGYIEDEAFYLVVIAPNKEKFEEFQPTWEQMVRSIRAVKE